jgi:nicotinamide riboside kinase
MKTVLLTGTLAAGKTTLLRELSTCPIVRGVPEVARDLLRDFPHLQAAPIFQKLLAEEQCRRESEARRSDSPVLVFDRGTIDILAYCKYFGHDPPLFETRCPYDYVFVCDPRDIDETVVRHGAREMRSAIDLAIRAQLVEMQIEYQVLQGPLSKRCATLVEIVAADMAPIHKGVLGQWLARLYGPTPQRP